MSAIHQIYCTHCTRGSSALERSCGELADRMLGYSARAGSVEGEQLRQYYRQIDRYIYYYLPRDTPGEEKLHLTPQQAPKRLIYMPPGDGLQLLGQVSYRQRDTEGRPGSYFAHAVFCPLEGQPGAAAARTRWSVLEGLGLWGAAGWVAEDSPDIPFGLPTLGSLDELLQGRPAAIDDAVWSSFLTTPPGGAFHDPGTVIPDRWRRTSPQQRFDLFARAFRGFLGVNLARRESLLLVVEPSMAALLFYGILRLLPAGPLREGVSFSTFEPAGERPSTSLSATSFFDPGVADLRPEAYRSPGAAINTFNGRQSEGLARGSRFAELVLGRLASGGPEAVDQTLAGFETAGARRREDLEELTELENAAPMLLDPTRPPPQPLWNGSPMKRGYFRAAVAGRLVSLSTPQAVADKLSGLAGRPQQLAVLELVATRPEVPEAHAAVDFLVRSLHGNQLCPLVRLDLEPRRKVQALAGYLGRLRDAGSPVQLPPDCEYLWEEPSPAEPGGEPSLLARTLANLDGATLKLFCRAAWDRREETLTALLVEANRIRASTPSQAPGMLGELDDRAIQAIFDRYGEKFFRQYPPGDAALAGKLQAMLHGVHTKPKLFAARLALLAAAREHLPQPARADLDAWQAVHHGLLTVGELQAAKSRLGERQRVARLEGACRVAAEAILRAMPPGKYDHAPEMLPLERMKVLRVLAKALTGENLLPGSWPDEALRTRISQCLQRGTWLPDPLVAPREASPGIWGRLKRLFGNAILLTLLIILAVGAAVVGGLHWLDVRDPLQTRDSGEVADAGVPTDGRTDEPRESVAETKPARPQSPPMRTYPGPNQPDPSAPPLSPPVSPEEKLPPPPGETPPWTPAEKAPAEEHASVPASPWEVPETAPDEKPAPDAPAAKTPALPVPQQIGPWKPGASETLEGEITVLRRRQNLVPRPQRTQYTATFEGQVFVGHPKQNPGQLLSAGWYDQGIRTTLAVQAFTPGRQYEQTIDDIYHNSSLGLIRAGTTRMLVQFQFYRAPAQEGLPLPPPGESPVDRLLAKTAWQPVEQIEAGTNHIIRLKLTPVQSEILRTMVKEHQ